VCDLCDMEKMCGKLELRRLAVSTELNVRVKVSNAAKFGYHV